MQVSVETTQGLERRLTITIPAEKIDTQVKTRLIQLSKTQRIDGFRPGKVPASVINKRYGKAVRDEVAGDTIQRNFYEAVVAEKLNPAGQPSIETVKNETGADLEFVATFEVYPEVTVAGLDAIEVEQPVVNVGETDLDAMIETLRKQNATWVESKKAAKADDKVTIDFIGKIDGEEFEGGKAEAFALEMGQNKMIPGFEDGIVGLKAGKEKTITVSFPEDYHAENLKGKEATFDITLTKVEVQELPELNEEFASLFNVADIPALRAEVEKNMKRELEQTLKGTVKEQIISGLIDNNELDVPKALIDGEVEVLRKQAMQRFGDNAANMPELPANLFEEQAVRRVKIGLLLNEVIKGNELKVDDERVTALIENMASAYEDPSEVVEYYKNNQEMMQQMRGVALEEQAIEFVLAQAKVTEVEKAFDEVMNKQA